MKTKKYFLFLFRCIGFNFGSKISNVLLNEIVGHPSFVRFQSVNDSEQGGRKSKLPSEGGRCKREEREANNSVFCV